MGYDICLSFFRILKLPIKQHSLKSMLWGQFYGYV